MDASVIRAMARWPDVPAVYGWLSLDRRGRWLLQGSTIGNRAAVEFIARNYGCDRGGRWYFQNGPQRVFVSLEYTPWVLHLQPAGELRTHTDLAVRLARGVLLDETGNVLVDTEHGVGLLVDRDLEAFSNRLRDPSGGPLADDETEARLARLAACDKAQLTVELCGRRLSVGSVRRREVASRFAFVPDPTPAQKA